MSKPGVVILKCGGENRAHIKRFGTETPVGGGQPIKVMRILKCESSFQDSLYGKDMRVMNHADSKGSQPNRYRCTVCCKEHNA